MQLVLTLNTFATHDGIEISPPPPSLLRLWEEDGDDRHLRAESSRLRPIVLRSNPDKPRAIVGALLNCRDPRTQVYDNRLRAFTSQYGFLVPNMDETEHEGYQYLSISFTKHMVSWLGKFAGLCERRDAEAIHAAIVAKWSDKSKTLFFEPSVSSEGLLVPQLVVPSLFQFCIHELLTIYYDGATAGVCAHCGSMQYEAKRADAKYCSDRCRTAHHRLRQRTVAKV